MSVRKLLLSRCVTATGVWGLVVAAGCLPQQGAGPSGALVPVPDSAVEPMAPADVELRAEALLAAGAKVMEGVDELEWVSTEVDDVSMGHVRYRQLQDGVVVFGGEAIVHLTPRGAFAGLSDSLVRSISIDTEPTLDADVAAMLAVAAHEDEGWVDGEPEVRLRVLADDDAARLTWMVTLRLMEAEGLVGMPVVFVDAHSGEIAYWYDNLQDVALDDVDRITFDNRGSTSVRAAVVGDSSDRDLRTTHDAIGATLDFLADQHGRDSWDDRGAVVYSFGHYGRRYANAYWDGQRLVFGDGDGRYSGYMGVLDIAAHELGHALTDAEAALIYAGESGALNEAASDMLAAVVEASVDGRTSDSVWDIGEDTWLAGRALRYMQAPPADGASRSHYAARFTGYGDNGGVHINSGIANHWFYLLAEGGQHHDARFRSGRVVQGVGIEPAYDIWYTALTRYMTRSTDFIGAREATEAACSAVGYPEAVCDAVQTAWFEVGVGGPPPTRASDEAPEQDAPAAEEAQCPAGWSAVSGRLDATGTDARFGYSVNAGTHQFQLRGPAGSDFDLYLYRVTNNDQYDTIGAATSASSQETLEVDSSAGDHLIQVRSYEGSGAFTLCYALP